jgi:hypothetical protein
MGPFLPAFRPWIAHLLEAVAFASEKQPENNL